MTGVAQYLKEQNNNIKIGLVDPYGAALYSFFTEGKLESEGSSVTEGIGQGRITKNLEGLEVDFPFRVPDADALEAMFKMVETEGLKPSVSTILNLSLIHI